MSKKQRRPQKPKNQGNEKYMRGMQDIRFSNASGPHKPKNAYTRRVKHVNRGLEQ